MAQYMALRIINGVYTYDFVISKRPDLQPGIDDYLNANGYSDLITTPVV